MSEISAALANSQLKKLDFFINERNSIAKTYLKYIKNPKFVFQKNLEGVNFIFIYYKTDIQKNEEYLRIFKIFKKNDIY